MRIAVSILVVSLVGTAACGPKDTIPGGGHPAEPGAAPPPAAGDDKQAIADAEKVAHARAEPVFARHCAPCHTDSGNGQGILYQRGKVPTADLASEKVRVMPDGQIFDTITNGFGLMQGYRWPIPAHDRWAIVAHVRELQAKRPPEAAPPQTAVIPPTAVVPPPLQQGPSTPPQQKLPPTAGPISTPQTSAENQQPNFGPDRPGPRPPLLLIDWLPWLIAAIMILIVIILIIVIVVKRRQKNQQNTSK